MQYNTVHKKIIQINICNNKIQQHTATETVWFLRMALPMIKMFLFICSSRSRTDPCSFSCNPSKSFATSNASSTSIVSTSTSFAWATFLLEAVCFKCSSFTKTSNKTKIKTTEQIRKEQNNRGLKKKQISLFSIAACRNNLWLSIVQQH